MGLVRQRRSCSSSPCNIAGLWAHNTAILVDGLLVLEHRTSARSPSMALFELPARELWQ